MAAFADRAETGRLLARKPAAYRDPVPNGKKKSTKLFAQLLQNGFKPSASITTTFRRQRIKKCGNCWPRRRTETTKAWRAVVERLELYAAGVGLRQFATLPFRSALERLERAGLIKMNDRIELFR